MQVRKGLFDPAGAVKRSLDDGADGLKCSTSMSVHPQITGQSVRGKTLRRGGQVEKSRRKRRAWWEHKRRRRALARRKEEVGVQCGASSQAWLLHHWRLASLGVFLFESRIIISLQDEGRWQGRCSVSGRGEWRTGGAKGVQLNFRSLGGSIVGCRRPPRLGIFVGGEIVGRRVWFMFH